MAAGRVLQWIRSLNVRRALLRLLQKLLLRVDYGDLQFFCHNTCEGSCSGSHIQIFKSVRALVMVLWDGWIGTRHLRSFCYGNCKVSCDRVDVAIWEVLAMAPARFPAMDRMMETARVLVMVVRTAGGLLRWIESGNFCKGLGDGFCYSLCKNQM